jgi:hypothetical protein
MFTKPEIAECLVGTVAKGLNLEKVLVDDLMDDEHCAFTGNVPTLATLIEHFVQHGFEIRLRSGDVEVALHVDYLEGDESIDEGTVWLSVPKYGRTP